MSVRCAHCGDRVSGTPASSRGQLEGVPGTPASSRGQLEGAPGTPASSRGQLEGAPGTPASSREDLAFCCTGCEAVYHAIHSAGLEHFYELGEGERLNQPDGLEAVELQHPDFLKQIQTNPDGTNEVELYLDGVHCAGCVWLVERMPQALDGVVDSRLNLSRARLRVRWSPDSVGLSEMGQWLARFGYVPHPVDQARSGRHSDAERRMLMRVGIGWALAANVMLIAASLYAGLDTSTEAGLDTAARWASMVLTALAVVFGGREFFERAWASLANWQGFDKLSVDVPISLGIAVGFSHSAWSVVTGSGEIWFDSIAVLIAALLTARWLQMRGRRHASDAAERLLRLLPAKAYLLERTVLGPQKEWKGKEIPADQLQVDDLVEVRLGDIVPADGTIVEGASSVHRAILTGESRPEAVAEGDEVHAGETNLSNRLVVRVSAAGQETRVGKLLAWVEEAAENRAPVVQLADAISGWFVVIVVAAAALTFGVWYMLAGATIATHHAVALLVISCPCALGMATPLALTVGMGKAARKGIFIKHDDVIEALRRVDTVVFDKTGTLTEGRMRLVDTHGVDDEILAMAAALEQKSHHPIARAFDPWRAEDSSVHVGRESVPGNRSADVHVGKRPMRLNIANFSEHAGLGVEGVVDGRHIRIGRPDWLGAEDIEGITKRAYTPLAIEVDGALVGCVALGDATRPEARKVIENLRARGIRPLLLSGDHPEVVEATGVALGLDAGDCLGAQTPEMKLAFVENLAAEGHRAAMIGDGVNDAAALQAAEIGIAVHGGTDLNLVAADIFLTRPGLEPVLALFEGAGEIMRVVRRNLVGSATYNIFGITLAALGFVSPLFAAVAMPVSSLSVVLSSLIQSPFEKRSEEPITDAKPRLEPAEA